MKKKNNAFRAEFKSKVVLDLLNGQRTLKELAEKYHIAPATLSSWHKQFQECATEIFQRGPSELGKMLKDKEQEQTNPGHGESQENLDIMKIIDLTQLERPSLGYRKMTDHLQHYYG